MLLVSAWGAVVVAQATGRIGFAHADVVVWFTPVLVIGIVASLRRPVSSWVWWVLGGCLLASMAAALTVEVVPHQLAVLAVPVALVAAILCARMPVATLLAVFAISSAYGSLMAFTSIPPSKTSELLLGGLWIAVAWRWIISGRRPSIAIVPGLCVLAAFIALSFAQAVGTASPSTGFHTFTSTGYFMGTVALVGLLGLTSEQLNRLARGIVVIAVVVAAYAMVRHGIGASSKEAALAAQQPYNYKDGKLLLIGSFLSRHQLGQWSALLAAFCAGYAPAVHGLRRLACLAVIPMAALACLWAESRSGLAAAVTGVVAALLLLHLARAFPGPRLGVLLFAGGAMAVAGAAAIALSGSAQTSKFTDILHPKKDQAYQERQQKWKQAIKDIKAQPFGHGVGTANSIQQQSGRFVSIGNFDIDNSVLRVAYEQGVQGALIWLAGIALLIVGLGRRAALTSDPARAGPAIAATATLVAYATMVWPSNVFDGYIALVTWTLVGVGLAPFLARAAVPAPERSPAQRVAPGSGGLVGA